MFNQDDIERDTRLLVEYSRDYPQCSVLSLRKIIKQFNGNRVAIDKLLKPLDKENTDLAKSLTRNSRSFVNDNLTVKSYGQYSPSPEMQRKRNTSAKSFARSSQPFVNENLSVKSYSVYSPSPEMQRKRHVSAPQHLTPRILVLPPTQLPESAVSFGSNTNDGSFTPDSLINVPIRRKRPDQKDTDSYDTQFHRLWKSISREGEDSGRQLSAVDLDRDYVNEQQDQLALLQKRFDDLCQHKRFLSLLNWRLINLKQRKSNTSFVGLL